ncbi:MAG: 3-deoxy-7-phosphoheptulonate synthase, partial [Actinomycetaceae bacterium]|nr:3-deoxy-7-phosphoheptulonate synthase [Actinomycetaceae bacterium]
MNDELHQAHLHNLESWRDCPAKHQPHYASLEEVNAVASYIRTLPPLVFAGEADNLTHMLARAGAGDAFVLQGGDCAESFSE